MLDSIEYIGRDARDVALRYHDVVKAIQGLVCGLFDARIKIFVEEPDQNDRLEWTAQIRSCAGQQTLRITQNVPLGAVSISKL